METFKFRRTVYKDHTDTGLKTCIRSTDMVSKDNIRTIPLGGGENSLIPLIK